MSSSKERDDSFAQLSPDDGGLLRGREQKRKWDHKEEKGGEFKKSAAHSRSDYVSASQTPALGMLMMQNRGGDERPTAARLDPERRTAPNPMFASTQSSVMEPRRVAPGAVAVSDMNDEVDSGTVAWGDDTSVKSSVVEDEEVDQRPQAEHLVSATLVEDEPPPSGPIVTATRFRKSLLNDRRVQAVIVIIVLTAIGVTAWALTRPDAPVPTDAPSEQPSSAPSYSPGRLVGRFCSQDPFNSYGGDFCPEGLSCQSCPTPNERLSVCLGEGTPSQVLEVYCTNTLSQRSRPCGDSSPTCPLENYCVPCESYTPPGELEGHVCFPPDLSSLRRGLVGERYLQDTVESDGYAFCNGATLSPTPIPAQNDFFPPVEPPTSSSFAGTETAFPTARRNDVEGLLSSVSLDGGAALNTSGSPQNRALQALLGDSLLSDNPDDIIQRYALIVFYYSTRGSQWRSSVGWLDSGDVCDWQFVGCGGENFVTSIVAPNNLLLGPLPSEFYLLGSLVFLGFYRNELSGTIPTELGLLTNLANLDLDSNSLSGAIPSELSTITNVEYLYANNNLLKGTIPSQLGALTKLQSLILSNNTLTGTVPREVCNLGFGNLQVLTVDVEVDCSSCSVFVETCHPAGSK